LENQKISPNLLAAFFQTKKKYLSVAINVIGPNQ